jgi:lysophospholipase L1-like esterase
MMDLAAMAADGFHPGPAVYRRWAQELARRIIERRPRTIREQTA